MAAPARIRHLLQDVSRRGILKTIAGLSLSAFGASSAWARKTPSAMEGPFYPTPEMRFSDADNNLVKISGVVKRAGGDVIVLKGRVLDGEGQPVEGARVEIWQCDVNGRYLHPGDRNSGLSRDAAFQGFGHVLTGSDGAYAFRTIKPVPYPGRAPHIHVKVLLGDQELTTQFYIAGHPLNDGDFLFQRMSSDEQRSVVMTFVEGQDAPEASVDITI